MNQEFSDWAKPVLVQLELELARWLPEQSTLMVNPDKGHEDSQHHTTPYLGPAVSGVEGSAKQLKTHQVFDASSKLQAAMRYAVMGAGKRIRPLLVYASGELLGVPASELHDLAVAVELVHAYSLVHDDLPCMDDDSLRRGRPTVHIQFDEATALLAGDALQTLAFEVLAQSKNFARAQNPALQNLKAIHLLAQAAGRLGMVGGQAIDLDSVAKTLNLEALEIMHQSKTGALLGASILLGAHAGDANQQQEALLRQFAHFIGLAFQVVDDVLDATASTTTLGKTAGKDAQHNKPTYVSILGMQSARQWIKQLHQQAHQTLLSFGEKAQHLCDLADVIVLRNH